MPMATAAYETDQLPSQTVDAVVIGGGAAGLNGALMLARSRRSVVVIDGGKGQLNAAYEALEEIGLANLIAIGLAKKEELVFVRESDRPIAMDPHGAPLRLLQRYPARILELPFEMPGLEYFCYWHRSADHDQGSRWLREQLMTLMGGIGDVQ